MDITTIIGIVLGFALIINGIALEVTETGIAYVIENVKNFFDVPSLIIVLGGTIAAIVANYSPKHLKAIPKHLKIMLDGKKFDPMEYIDTLVDFAQIARKNGLLALEEKANQVDDPFFKQSLMLIVDATDADRVKEMLNNDLDNLVARHEEVVGMYERGSATAPAFGMIGTLVGLINMLRSMDLSGSGGAGSLGSSMSVALVTTFYGCILANVIFNPIATKLKIRHSEEELCKTIIIEGVLSIQAGENPKFLKEKLISFLPQAQRDAVSEESQQ